MKDLRLYGRENENHHLWCDALSLGRNLPTLWRSVLFPSSGFAS